MNNSNGILKRINIVLLLAIFAAALILFSKGLLLGGILFLNFILLYLILLKNFAFWQCNIIILLSGYFILPRSFSYVGLHLKNFYIFIGEIIIILSLLLYNFKPVIAKLFKHTISKWLIAWILLGSVLAVANIPKHQLVEGCA